MGFDMGIEGRVLWSALAVMFILVAGRVATANELSAIDCGSSPFGFSGQGYNLDCERSDTQTHVEGASGSVRFDVITISSDDRTLFLTMTSQLITAPRIYLEHRSLSQSFNNMFEREGVAEWKGVGNKAGYDIAEFKTDISGHESRCLAIQRYTNAAWTGYKRHIVGMGCAITGLDAVYDMLSKLSAPGD